MKKLFIIGLSFLVIGIGSAIFISLNHDEKEDITIDVPVADESYISNISDIKFINVSKGIYLGDVIPTLDKFGVMNDSFNFTIKNNGPIDKKYILSLQDNNSTILNKMIRYEIVKNDLNLGIYTLSDDGIIDVSKIESNEEVTYSIKMWLDYNSNVKVGKLNKKVSVIENNNIETFVNKPVLIDGMIPVYYDYNDMSYHKSSMENTYYYKWYDYDNNLYANTVTVNPNVQDLYINSSIGTKINMADINSIWVWIPRFNYEMNNKSVDIKYVGVNENAFSAFNFNNEEISGFWISKFESSLDNSDECIISSITSKCNTSSKKLLFKPNNLYTDRITMANLFYSIRSMELKNNIYGFKGNGTKVNSDGTIKNDDNNYDIHMVRNSEWEGVSILSLSKYGNNTIASNSTNYTGNVFYNDNIYAFNIQSLGDMGSTSGNITGVYDMVGGKAEFVMIDIDNNLFNKKSDSGFTGKVKEYYYDTTSNMDILNSVLNTKYEVKYGPVVRGGYKRVNNNILSMYNANNYINKISLETNSRAVITVRENTNG